MSAWQRGFDLDWLKTLAGPFALMHKPHVYGAFGLTKERDVAAALAEERLVWTRAEGGNSISAAAIYRVLKAMGRKRDFAGNVHELGKGSLVIDALAARDAGQASKILDYFRQSAPKADIWVEAFEEDEVEREALDAAGFGWQFSAIMAGSEIKGMYRHGRPAPELDDAEAATLRMIAPEFISEAELAAIEAELSAFEAAGMPWAQHYSGYNKRHSWTAFALRGYDASDPGFIIKPAEMSKKWKADNPERLDAEAGWTIAAEHFPATLEALAPMPGRLDRVRFMRLAHGDGELSRHADITDREAGVADGKLARLHIPIRTSPAVTFFAWDHRGRKIEAKFPARSAFYLDQRKPHRVTNSDPELDRVHLVLDIRCDEPLRRLIRGH